jgi:hypothetical protein
MPTDEVLRIVLVVAAVFVGAAVGLIPALLLGTVLGVLPKPSLARLRRRAPLAAPPPPPAPVRAAPVPLPIAFDLHPAEPPAPAPLVLAAPQGAASRERHRELYDAEYSMQLLRLERLRRKISARLARGAP